MRYAILLFFVFTLCGCSAIRFPSLPVHKRPETVYTYNEKQSTKPKAVINNGKVVVVEETQKEVIIGLEETRSKLSIVQRFGNWLSSLSILTFVIIIAGLFIAPTATVSFLFAAYRKTKNAFRETVVAIKNARVVDENANLKYELANKQSPSTKRMVDEITKGV